MWMKSISQNIDKILHQLNDKNVEVKLLNLGQVNKLGSLLIHYLIEFVIYIQIFLLFVSQESCVIQETHSKTSVCSDWSHQ